MNIYSGECVKNETEAQKVKTAFMKHFLEMKLNVVFLFFRKPNPVASAILEDKMNNITSLSNLLLGKGAPSKIVKLIQIRKSWPQQQAVPGVFLIFFATTLVNLLFNEHMSHLSHVKQMYSQPIHLTYELIL